MAIGFWFFCALLIFASIPLLVWERGDYRIVLMAGALIGLTPLGFIEGPGIPVFLPELLLITLVVGLVARRYRSLSSVKLPTFLLVFCAFFLLQLIIALMSYESSLVVLLRDSRPIAFVALLLLLSTTLRQTSWRHGISDVSVAIVVAICLLFDLLFYYSTNLGLLSAGGISGAFFSRTGLIRYSDLLTIPLFGLANYMVFGSTYPWKAFRWLAACGLIVALSLNRVFAIGFLIALSWWLYSTTRYYTNRRGIAVVAATTPIVILGVVGVSFASSQQGAGEVVSRITELFSLSLLMDALKYRFIEPALVGGYELTPLTFIFGEGMGFKFYVPWFEYRGIDPWHFSVDSILGFAFFKYGVVGLGLLLHAITKFIWRQPLDLANAWVWIYLLVHSGINVPGFLIMLVMLVVLRDGSWMIERSGTMTIAQAVGTGDTANLSRNVTMNQ